VPGNQLFAIFAALCSTVVTVQLGRVRKSTRFLFWLVRLSEQKSAKDAKGFLATEGIR